MPGRAVIRPPTTRRSEGTTVIRRSTRRTRSARKTEKAPVDGTSAMPTTNKSNRLHGSRKKAARKTMIRAASSITKTARTARSSA